MPAADNAPEGAAAGAGAEAAREGTLPRADREPFSLEDADATVETLLLMEYADVGTLDQRIVQGRLKGDLVRIVPILRKIFACRCTGEWGASSCYCSTCSFDLII